MMRNVRSAPKLALMLVPLLASGCGRGLDELTQLETGMVRVTLQRTAGAMSSEGLGMAALPARVLPSQIASLEVEVIGIQFLPASVAEDEEPEWVTLELEEPVVLDLLALPTENDSPIVIAAGDVPVGEYRRVRLLVGEATVEFGESISLGQAFTFDPNVPYAVEIPSADRTGIKTDVSFAVEEIEGVVADVPLVFDEGATFANLTVTGNGRVLLAPVIHAAP